MWVVKGIRGSGGEVYYQGNTPGSEVVIFLELAKEFKNEEDAWKVATLLNARMAELDNTYFAPKEII